MSVTAAVFHRETSPLNEYALENMPLEVDVRVGLSAACMLSAEGGRERKKEHVAAGSAVRDVQHHWATEKGGVKRRWMKEG